MKNQSYEERERSSKTGSRYSLDDIEDQGERILEQVTENLPSMESTLNYVRGNWKTIAQTLAVIGVLGAVSAYARSRTGSSRSNGKHERKSASKMKH